MLWAPSVALLNVVTKAGAQAFLHSVQLIEGSFLLGLLMHQVMSKGKGKEMTLPVQTQKTSGFYKQ